MQTLTAPSGAFGPFRASRGVVRYSKQPVPALRPLSGTSAPRALSLRADQPDLSTPFGPSMLRKRNEIRRFRALPRGGSSSSPQAVSVQHELGEAAAEGQLPRLRQMLQQGADATHANDEGQTALHLFAGVQNTAISHSYYKFLCTDTIKKLLHAGANIDAADHQGWTPLHHACARGHDTIVGALLMLGANASAESPVDITPLHIAAQLGHEGVASLLLEHGASLMFDATSDCKGWTPIHCAADNYQPSMLKLLLEHGTSKDANAADAEGWTPLHVAVCNKGHIASWMSDNPELAYSFEEAKQAAANESASSSPSLPAHGYLSLQAVLGGKQMSCVEALLEHGAETQNTTAQGWTPLHCAASGAKSDVPMQKGIQDNANLKDDHQHKGSQQAAPFGAIDVQVVKGDLTQQQVAAIVNPTSGHLSLTSKVSGAIQKAAGRKLKTACKKLLANLPDGGLAIGSAATMPIRGNPFQNIIHAVTPSAMGNAKKDAVALASTVQNVLAQAARNGMQSIAMPLIGNGNAGWPTALAAQAHLQGLLQLVATDKDSSVLKEIRFVDTDDQAIAALQHELTKQKPVCDPVAQDNARAGSQSIKVIKGDLTQQQVTAIVHPTNDCLHAGGGTAAQIAKVVGPAFERDCKAAWASLSDSEKNSLEGNCLVTACDGGLPFQHIIHAAGPSHSSTCQAVYASTVRSVLERAATEGMQSLAMPLIGSGSAGWPVKLAAQISIEETLDFFYGSSSMSTSLKEVKFVDTDGEAIEALEAELAKQQGSLRSQPKASNGSQNTISLLQGAPKPIMQPCNDFQAHMQHIQFLDSDLWLQNLDKSLSAHDFVHDASQPQADLLMNLMQALLRDGSTGVVPKPQFWGAGVNATDKLGHTALHLAAATRHQEAIRVLLSLEADVNRLDPSGRTALDYAVCAQSDGAVELLLEAGASHAVEVAPEGHGEEHTAASQEAAAELESQLDDAQNAVNELQKHLTAVRLFQQHDVTMVSTQSQSQGYRQQSDTDMYREVKEAALVVREHLTELVCALDTSLEVTNDGECWE